MILITGATGQLGTSVVRHLLKSTPANQIAALVRDEGKAADFKAQGVSIRVGNYDDTASLDAAMQGVDQVLLIAGTDGEKIVQQHQNVVDAAKKAGVTCVAYTSRALKDPATLQNTIMRTHFETEDLIEASGLNYIFFRNALYMDTLPWLVGKNVLETGIRLPVGAGRCAFALRSDMGEGIANALAQTSCDNQTYFFTGSEAYSFDDVAAALSRLSGKEVKYTPINEAEFVAQMKERGIPDAMIEMVVSFPADIKNGQEDEVSADLERWLGRKPTPIEAGLKSLFNL